MRFRLFLWVFLFLGSLPKDSQSREMTSSRFASIPNNVSADQIRPFSISPDLSYAWEEDENSARLVDMKSGGVNFRIPVATSKALHASIRKIRYLDEKHTLIETSGNHVTVLSLPFVGKPIYSKDKRRFTEFLPKSNLLILLDSTTEGVYDVVSLEKGEKTASIFYSDEMAFSEDQTIHYVIQDGISEPAYLIKTDLITGKTEKTTFEKDVYAGTSLDGSFLIETSGERVTLTPFNNGKKRFFKFDLKEKEESRQTRLRHGNTLLLNTTWNKSVRPPEVNFRTWDTHDLEAPVALPVFKTDNDHIFTYAVSDRFLVFFNRSGRKPDQMTLSVVDRKTAALIHDSIPLTEFGLLPTETLNSYYLPENSQLVCLEIQDLDASYTRFSIWDLDKKLNVFNSLKYERATIWLNETKTRLLVSHVTTGERAQVVVLDAHSLKQLGNQNNYRVKNLRTLSSQKLVILRRTSSALDLPHREVVLDITDGSVIGLPSSWGEIHELENREDRIYFVSQNGIGHFTVSP